MLTPSYVSNVLSARILSSLGPQEEATEAWRALIQKNSDYTEYYRGFLRTKNIDIGAFFTWEDFVQSFINCSDSDNETDRTVALSVLDELSAQLASANAIRRLALTVSSGKILA